MELSTILVIMNTVILISLGNVTRQLADQNNKNDEIKLFSVLIFWHISGNINCSYPKEVIHLIFAAGLIAPIVLRADADGNDVPSVVHFQQSVNDYPFRNTSLTWKQRVDDLVSRLTLDEITQQVTLLQPLILTGLQFKWHLSSEFVQEHSAVLAFSIHLLRC